MAQTDNVKKAAVLAGWFILICLALWASQVYVGGLVPPQKLAATTTPKPLAPAEDAYRCILDLRQTADDHITVQLTVPRLQQPTVDFVLPVSVPGFYNTNLQFGELVSELAAFDQQGRQLPLTRKAPNRWTIERAPELRSLRYVLDDVWEKRPLSHWLPAENIFRADTVFLLNHGATLGYLDGHANRPFHVTLHYPPQLFPASGLRYQTPRPGQLRYQAATYHELTDKPILLTPTKPVEFNVGRAAVSVAVYAERGGVTAAQVSRIVQPIFTSIERYLGQPLPVDKYAFLAYFYAGPVFAAAALEHHNSAVYVLPENWDAQLLGSSMEENLRNTSAHEFFHIIAPLNIHSEELLNFDFAGPRMSQHLWLYEGTTEYLTQHMQVQQRLKSPAEFARKLTDLTREMQEYRPDVSLRDVSLETYGRYADEYDNVELKGVLVNLLLDIELVERSQGRYSLKQLMLDLAAKYGRDQSFKDEELFDVIARMTYPDVRSFFARYVEDTDPLPLREYLSKVGFGYDQQSHQITVLPAPTPQQVALRNAWLYGSK